MLNKLKLNNYIDPHTTCPCGSKKHFKYCCFKKNFTIEKYIQKLAQIEINKRTKNKSEFLCILNHFGIECEQPAINSHTISSSANLKHLKNKNNELFKITQNYKQGFSFEEININKSSIFNGLCFKHDKCYNQNVDTNFSIDKYKDYLCMFKLANPIKIKSAAEFDEINRRIGVAG